VVIIIIIVIIMFEWLTLALFNDDERDTTDVPKQILNTILFYHF